VSGVEPYVTESPPHHPRWYGDVGIVAAAVLIVAAIASTLSWCDFSLQSYRLSAGVPLLLCPGGASSGDIPAGTTVRVTAVYSGSLGEFRELSAPGGTNGWAVAADIDAASGVTTRDIFGLPSVSDPAFDGPDCTSTAPTTVVTTETTEATNTTAVETTAVATTAAGATTTVARTTGRTTTPRPTIRPTVTTTPTATTVPKTTTTADTDGPDIGPVRLKPSTITEPNGPDVATVCAAGTTIAQLSVSVTDPSGVQSVTYAATVKGLSESGILSNVDEVYSGTVGPFSGAFTGNGDKATSAVIAVLITATDKAGNVTRTTGSGTLLRCNPPPTTTTTVPSTTTSIIF
jgi:hypothetical protein